MARHPRKRDLQPEPVTPPRCPYCGQAANLERHPSGPRFKPVWTCARAECDARVGTKDDRRTPLGTLANAALRVARMRAHATFDTLWKGKPKRRRCGTFPGPRHKPAMRRWEAYAWLSEQMGLAAELCHIGRFNEAQCKRVVELVTAWP